MRTSNRGRGRRGRAGGKTRARSDQHAQAPAAAPVDDEEQIRCPLLPEMPALWLTQFIGILHNQDRKALRALLGVNKALFNVVLQHIPFMRLFMTLGPSHGGKWPQGQAAARVLAMASNAQPKYLMLDARPAATALNDVTRVGFTTAVKLVITSAASQCGGSLPGINGLALHAVKFESTLCPRWLSSAFPSMTKYCVSMSTITGKSVSDPDIQYMPLVDNFMLIDVDVQMNPTQLAAQLKHFPNIATLGARGFSNTLALAFQKGMPSVTTLIVEGAGIGHLPVALKGLHNLRHLKAYDDLSDADFVQVAQMPSIQELSCASFDMIGDYSKMRCSWKTPITLHAKQLTLANLARLPLKHIASIAGCGQDDKRLTIKTCLRNEPTGIIKTAIQNLESAPALRFACQTLRLKTLLSHDELKNTARLLSVLLQVIPRLTSVTTQIEFSRLNPADRAVFAEINKAMQNITNELTVVFSACIFETDDLSDLMPSLPRNVHTVRFVGGSMEADPLHEEDLELICQSVQRPVTIQVAQGCHDMGTGWRQRLLRCTTKRPTIYKIEQAQPPHALAWDDSSGDEHFSGDEVSEEGDYDDYYGSESEYEDEFDAQEARLLELAMAGLGTGYRYEDEYGFLASHYAAGFDDPSGYGLDDDDDDDDDDHIGNSRNAGNAANTGHQPSGHQQYCPCCSTVTVTCSTTGATITVPLELHRMVMRGMAMAPNPLLPGAPENAMDLVSQAAQTLMASAASTSGRVGGGGRAGGGGRVGGGGRAGGGGVGAGVRVGAGRGGPATATTNRASTSTAGPSTAPITRGAANPTTTRTATANAAATTAAAEKPIAMSSSTSNAGISSQPARNTDKNIQQAAGSASAGRATTAANNRGNISWVTVRPKSGK